MYYQVRVPSNGMVEKAGATWDILLYLVEFVSCRILRAVPLTELKSEVIGYIPSPVDSSLLCT